MTELEQLLEAFTPRGAQEISDMQIFKRAATDPSALTRDALAHFTASAIVLNPQHDKILGIFHKIYQSWGWLGGHADGDGDLLAVARREVEEESGLTELKILSDAPISIEDLTVAGHVHRTRGYVSAHLHLNVTFLFEADDTALLRQNKAETGGIAWIPIDEFVEKSTEPEMKIIYQKIISRIGEWHG
ncbi:MAG: NUDIX hydrolase [Streptococcaceae bacterium]|nr:NUDIX hydrolase [Streptococcaceae bacterium]